MFSSIQANVLLICFMLAMALFTAPVYAQHLWWDVSDHKAATCVYGEITVLATGPGIYYCGANWHPAEPAGGYCGIQHNSDKERRTIFSIWDTSPTLHPKVSESDPKTIFERFGGEGEGAHTHMLWNWQVGETFQFVVRKRGSTPQATDALYFVFDRGTNKWRHSATIQTPNGDAKSVDSVATIGGGGLGSFLENFAGKDQQTAKLALYRLWLSEDLDQWKCLTKATGDGVWGQLDDAYFLAEGGAKELDALYANLQPKHGRPQFGGQNRKLKPLADKALSKELTAALKSLKSGE